MNDNDQLISIWKSNKAIIENDFKLISSQNKDNVMETIIKFENKEKSEKNNQIVAAFVLVGLTVWFLYGVDLSRMHFLGIILLLTGVAYNIIANRTDNFPDFRQLNTIDYLQAFKENTLKRTKMHNLNLVIGLLFLIPGCYLTFRDSFPELGNWWIPIMVTSGLITAIIWFKNYNQRSTLVLNQVTELMNEFNNEE